MRETPHRPSREPTIRLGRLASVLTVALATTACGGPSPDQLAHRPDVEQARREASADVVGMLDRVAVGGRVLGRGHEDACDPGQHNWKVHTSYALQCQVRAFALVAPTTPLADSVRQLRGALADAGCSESSLTTAAVENDVRRHFGTDHGATCGSRYVTVVAVWHRRDAGFFGNPRTPTPDGFDISAAPLGAEVLDQVPATRPFAWVVEVSRQYADIPQ